MNRVTFTKFVAVPLASLAVLSVGAAIQGQTAPPKSASKAKASAKVLLDLNKATVDELEEQLSGVGPATAKKIVAGRPYSSVDDLAKAGVSQRVIDGIRDQVSVGAEPAAKSKPATSKNTKSKADDVKEAATGKVNLNTADAAALEALPGIGATTAKAIIAARPLKSIDDLDKIRGLGKNRINALRNLRNDRRRSGSHYRQSCPGACRRQNDRCDQGYAQDSGRPKGGYQHCREGRSRRPAGNRSCESPGDYRGSSV